MTTSAPSSSSSWKNGGVDTNVRKPSKSPAPTIAEIVKRKIQSQRIQQQQALEYNSGSVLGALVESAISKYQMSQDDLSLVDQVLIDPIVTTSPPEKKNIEVEEVLTPVRIYAEKSPRDSSLSATSTPAPPTTSKKNTINLSDSIKTPICKTSSSLPVSKDQKRTKNDILLKTKTSLSNSMEKTSNIHNSDHSYKFHSPKSKISSFPQNPTECKLETKPELSSTETENNSNAVLLTDGKKRTKKILVEGGKYSPPKTNTKIVQTSFNSRPKTANSHDYHELKVEKLTSQKLSPPILKTQYTSYPNIQEMTIPKKNVPIDLTVTNNLTIDLTTATCDNVNKTHPTKTSNDSPSKAKRRLKKKNLETSTTTLSSAHPNKKNTNSPLKSKTKKFGIDKPSKKLKMNSGNSPCTINVKTMLSSIDHEAGLSSISATEGGEVSPRNNQPKTVTTPIIMNDTKVQSLRKNNSSLDLNSFMVEKDLALNESSNCQLKSAYKTIDIIPKSELKKRCSSEHSNRVSNRKRKALLSPSYTQYSTSLTYTNDFVKRTLLELIVKIRLRVDAYGFFSGPVDPIAHECPDYYDIVNRETEAMDLDTLQKYVEQGRVSTIQQFEAYLKRIVYCAQKYNTDKTNFVRTQADEILPLSQSFLKATSKKLEKYYNRMKRKHRKDKYEDDNDDVDDNDEDHNDEDHDDDSSNDGTQKEMRHTLEKLSKEELIEELNKLKDKNLHLKEKPCPKGKSSNILSSTTQNQNRKFHPIDESDHEINGSENLSQQSSDCSTSDEIRMALEYASTSEDSDNGEYIDLEQSEDETLTSFASFEENYKENKKKIKLSPQINDRTSRRKPSRRIQSKGDTKKITKGEEIFLRSKKGKHVSNSHQNPSEKKVEKEVSNKTMHRGKSSKVSQKEPRVVPNLSPENDKNIEQKNKLVSDCRHSNESFESDQKKFSIKTKKSLIADALIPNASLHIIKKKRKLPNEEKRSIGKKQGKPGDKISLSVKKQAKSKGLGKKCVYDDVEEFIDGVDIPHCDKDLSNSTVTKCSARTKWLSLISEMVIVCNEATRRSTMRQDPTAEYFEKPLSEVYIRERLEYDKPLNGFIIRAKESPCQLQGFIITTNFVAYRKSFRWTMTSPAACLTPTDCRLHATDDGSLTDELQKVNRKGNALNGFIFHRVCELSFLGGLGCGGTLLEKTLSDLREGGEYDYIVLQSTKMAISFYERYGFVRVGAVNRFQDNERMPELAYRHWSEIVNGKAVESSYMMARRVKDINLKIKTSSKCRGRDITNSERRAEVLSALNSAKSLLIESFSIRATGSSTYTNSYRELFLAAKEFAISAGDHDLYNTIDLAIKEITKSSIGQSRLILKDLLLLNKNRGKHISIPISEQKSIDLKSELAEKKTTINVKVKVTYKFNDEKSFDIEKEKDLSVTITADIVERMSFQKSHEINNCIKHSWKKRNIRIKIVLNGLIVDSKSLEMHPDKSNTESASTSSSQGLYAKMFMPPMRENLSDLREATSIALDNFLSYVLVNENNEEESPQFLSHQNQMVKPGDSIMLKVPAYDGSDLWIAVEVERRCLKKEIPMNKHAKYGNCFILKFIESDGEKRHQRILDSWNRGVGREWCTMMDWHSFPVLPVKVLDALLLNCRVEYPNIEGKCVSGFISKRVGGGLNDGPKWRLNKKVKGKSYLKKKHSNFYEDLDPGALREAIYISDLHMKTAKEILTKTKLVNQILNIDDGRSASSEFDLDRNSPKNTCVDSGGSLSNFAHTEIINEEFEPLQKSSFNSSSYKTDEKMESQDTSSKQDSSGERPSRKGIKSKLTASSTTDHSSDWATRRDITFNLSSIINPLQELDFVTSHQEDNRFLFKTGVSTKNKNHLTSHKSNDKPLNNTHSNFISLQECETTSGYDECKHGFIANNSVSKKTKQNNTGDPSECSLTLLSQNIKLDSDVKRKKGRQRKSSRIKKNDLPT